MPHTLLNETFAGDTLHPLLHWMNPPSIWRIEAHRSRLLIEPDGKTDFWQETHYGFRADNGHFLYAEVNCDCVVTASFRCKPEHQYDQTGLMARFSADYWLKTSVEFEPDAASNLGAVVTNSGFSDWSFQEFPYRAVQQDTVLSYCLRLRREGQDFLIEHAPAKSGPWSLMRIARLISDPAQPCKIGLYACSPKERGCRVEVTLLHIEIS